MSLFAETSSFGGDWLLRQQAHLRVLVRAAVREAPSENVVGTPSQRSAGPPGYLSADSTRYRLELVMRTSKAECLPGFDDGIRPDHLSMESGHTSTVRRYWVRQSLVP